MSSINPFVKGLTALGMPENQAEFLANEQSRLIDNTLATKRDIADLKTDILASEQRMKISTGSMLVIAVVALTALDKIL